MICVVVETYVAVAVAVRVAVTKDGSGVTVTGGSVTDTLTVNVAELSGDDWQDVTIDVHELANPPMPKGPAHARQNLAAARTSVEHAHCSVLAETAISPTLSTFPVASVEHWDPVNKNCETDTQAAWHWLTLTCCGLPLIMMIRVAVFGSIGVTAGELLAAGELKTSLPRRSVPVCPSAARAPVS